VLSLRPLCMQDAVRLALTMGNLALAKDIVKSAPRDDGRSAEDELELVVAQRGAGEALLERRRRLWLMIARYTARSHCG